jgi:hypothetical protein
MPYMAYVPLTHDKVFQMRATDEFLRRIDDWRRRRPELPSRAEAIRRLIEAGLRAEAAPVSETTAPTLEQTGGAGRGARRTIRRR